MTFWFNTDQALAIAGFCCFTALIMAIVQIIQHLRHYTEPIFQRYIVRIIFLVPMYALCSFPSLIYEDAAIYITTIRDCYEAWVIYNFMSLCLAYVGGPGVVEVKMNGYVLLPSWAACTCCLPPMPVNGRFVRSCQRGALQFVLLKPILAVLTLVLYSTGHYTEGDWSVGDGYLWITIIYNLTYTLALYALLLFYMGTHDLLQPFRPLLKFILVKSVIFLTFWQGLLIAIAVGTGAIPSAADGSNVQNFLICVEMLPAAICMMFAFPWKEYAGGQGALSGTNVTHAMSIRDLVADTVHQFAPQYHNYVLYSDGTSKMVTTPDRFDSPRDGGMGIIPEADDVDLLSHTVEMGGVQAWGSGGGGGSSSGGAINVGGGGGSSKIKNHVDSALGLASGSGNISAASPRGNGGTKYVKRESDEYLR